MTIELNPLGNTCDLACKYCYLHPQRDAGNFGPRRYDMDRMKAGLLAEGGRFILHGGDPFQMDIADLEEVWRWGHERYGQNGAQTHGATLTDRHIELARTYNAHIGISIDGPGSMNDLRWAGSLEKTRRRTARSEASIEKLCAAGVGCSVIMVLHRLNMDPDRRDELKSWLRKLDALGVRGVRFHPMEVDHPDIAERYQLSMDEYIRFYTDMYEFTRGMARIRVDIIQDIRALLTGRDEHATCTWNACDPYTTAAVQGVDGQGNRTNCGRTNKDGVSFQKGDARGYERYIALYHTPQAHGGCQGCRYFFACKGQCVGEGIDGDWRNRSEYCPLYMALFRLIEDEFVRAGETPLSLSPKRPAIEKALVDGWRQGRNLQIHQILVGAGRRTGTPGGSRAPGPTGHGDSHGDAHGDHTDAHAHQRPPSALHQSRPAGGTTS